MKKSAYYSIRSMLKSRILIPVLILLCLFGTPGQVMAQTPLREPVPHDDFTLREEMVPMRDGVRLYTIILTPKHSGKALPILLERTPYDASRIIGDRPTSSLAVVLGNQFMGKDYIYVVQDIRGRFKSEGTYAMYRPPRGPFNKSETDETTDAWDAIDWLVKHVASNGRVGVWGTSYPGWLTLAAMRDPHPALAAAVPFNPVVDVWKADDWFHWGAFRAAYAFSYIYEMESRMDESTPYPYEIQDNYAWMLGIGAAGTGLGGRLDERHEMWYKLMENPAYGPYWREVAADRWFDPPPSPVPALHVHGLWDQEDIYGSPAVYAAIEKYDSSNAFNYFAAGPWYHGQHFANGSSLGKLHFDENTSKWFRREVLVSFLRHFLHGDGTGAPAPVTVFETGTNTWQTFDRWPPTDEQIRIYLQPGGGLGFAPPDADVSYTEYISDPARPVPYEPRPNWGIEYSNPSSIMEWRRWLVEDQRFVDGRPDVVTWVSEPLQAPLTVRGPVTAQLQVETTGTDADWVVKLIDVYPEDDPAFEMSGYQLMVSADIFRGRYREDFEVPKPIAPDEVLAYTIPLPQVNHTFLPGHRLMVQVQSSWFPLYDRNPQTYVPSIMTAPDEAYKAQRQRVHHSSAHPSYLRLFVDKPRP
jgi:putative CocE/NonD family hydrolase